MTLYSDLRLIDRYILDKGWRINEGESRPFSYKDFTDMYKHGSIRNAFSRLRKKGLVHLCYRTTLSFYAVKGSGLANYKHKITQNHKGSDASWPLLLSALPKDEDQVHDVRFLVNIKGFHDQLLSKGWKANRYSKDIKLKPLNFEKGRIVNIIVHNTDNVSVIIGCSRAPFYAKDGLLDLFLLLDNVRYVLEHKYLDKTIDIPPLSEWKVTAWHHGVDGRYEFSGERFNMSFEDWSGHLVRFYAKKTRDNIYYPRLERIESPNKTLEDIANEFFKS